MSENSNLISTKEIIEMALRDPKTFQIIVEKTLLNKIEKYCQDNMTNRSLLGRQLFLEFLKGKGLIKKKGEKE